MKLSFIKKKPKFKKHDEVREFELLPKIEAEEVLLVKSIQEKSSTSSHFVWSDDVVWP